jgi:hypothetical protein
MHTGLGKKSAFHFRKEPSFNFADQHPVVTEFWLGLAIGKPRLAGELILTSDETVEASRAFGNIYN